MLRVVLGLGLGLGLGAGLGAPAMAQALTGEAAATLLFPANGAEVELLAAWLKVKVAGGTAPFTWLADGVPVVVGSDAREAMLVRPGAGFVTLSVIDAEGRSDRVQVQVR